MCHSVTEERGHEACTCHICVGEVSAVGFVQVVVTFHQWGMKAGRDDGCEEGGWRGERGGGWSIGTGEEGGCKVAGECVAA